MSWEVQRPVDGLVGELSIGCTDIDTQVSAAVFADLPADYSQSLYIPLLLSNDSLGVFEIVYGYGHVANSTSITVSRAMRGTSARTWPQGTVVQCAPTTYDTAVGLSVATANALGDAYVGQRVLDPALKAEFEKTYQGPFMGSVKYRPGSFGPAVEGNYLPPQGASPYIQAGHGVGPLTVGNGFFDVTLPQGAFLNGIIGIFATPYIIGGSDELTSVKANTSFSSGTKISFQCMGKNGQPMANGYIVNFSYLILGW